MAGDRLGATLGLEDPVSSVRLVSPARARALDGMHIESVRDLLSSYPRRYIDLSQVETILSSSIGEQCTIVGTIYDMRLKRPKPRLDLVELTITDNTGTLLVTCFRQPWLMTKYTSGMRVSVSGEIEFSYGAKRMTNPLIEELAASQHAGRIIPVHPACEQISTALMRTLMTNALATHLPLYDPIPVDLRMKYHLMSRQQALRSIHAPQSMEDVAQAKRRLIYEELLMVELLLLSEAAKRDAAFVARTHIIDGSRMRQFCASCPYTLTHDQQQAVRDILALMARPRRMSHLLLGDVGTGKTLVAAFALVAAADTGTQAVLMAPTELLATQHAHSLEALLAPCGVRVALLTGSTMAADRAVLLEGLAQGTIDVLVGTHAVLEDEVRFRDCSLVIIDEQQRFGVDQRARLLDHAPGADALFLTATPIPRTLALSLYGDLTLSYLRERPFSGAGRATHVVSWKDKGEAYAAAIRALERGEQVYVVCPLVESASGAPSSRKAGGATKGKNLVAAQDEESYAYAHVTIEDASDFPESSPASAKERARLLQETVFSNYEVGLVHGRMSGAEKTQVMDKFAKGSIQVLVATTVIEVGIDVPNATVMIIDSADLFGLSQLHQLRGRVGRGTKPGEVFLISGSASPAAMKRLAVMERTDDGFKLASYDLSLRREGDILGNRQHGASVLKLVNVVRDAQIVEAAHADAEALIDADPTLAAPEHRALARELRLMFGDNETKLGG